MSTNPQAAQPLAQRASSFIQSHRQALILTAAATTAIVGAASAYYLLGSSTSTSTSTTGETEVEKRERREKRRTRRERKGEEKKEDKEETNEVEDPLQISSTDIEVMDPDQRSKLALKLKASGNRAYSSKRFTEAIEYYSKAIEFEEQAVYYSNRAACYTNLSQVDKVIEDCTDALRLDPGYIKALNRRATARESLGGQDALYLALCDFTAAAIIDNFATESTQLSVERVMKRLAQEKTAELMKNRQPRLPSATFIKAYLEAFRPHPAPTLPPNPTQGDRTLALAFDALAAKDFTHAFTLFHESLSQDISTSLGEAEALNMRATFRFFNGDAVEALNDLDRSTTIWPEEGQSWVKKASVHMELNSPEEAFRDFDRALEINPEDPDVFYHRGQVYFIMGDFDKAIVEYRRSIELEPVFVYCHIQLAVAQYKSGSVDKALHQFRRFLVEYPDSPEVFNYYGELLLDQQRYEEAVSNFETSIELDKNTVPRNVLPMINQALAIFQWKQDFSAAEQICRKAISIDPRCDVGFATLAQLLLQQNKIYDAVSMFAKSAEMSRTEGEVFNALSYESATRAQIAFIAAYPQYAEKLGLTRNSDS